MTAEVITMEINGKELWDSLSVFEGLRFSPKFRLAIRTSESEIELLQDQYKDAAEMFNRSSKAGEAFADALKGVGRCLSNLATPSSSFGLNVECEEEIQHMIRTIDAFSELIAIFSARLLQPGNVFLQAGMGLCESQQTRKEFYRACDQVDAAINKAASVPRSRASDAEEADSTLLDARATFARVLEGYLLGLRTALGPVRLSTVSKATLTTYEIQKSHCDCMTSLYQTDGCVSTLQNYIALYEEEASHKPKTTTNGQSSSPVSDQNIRYEGHLFKRSKKKRWRTWVRRWFMVSDNRLVYLSSLSESSTTLKWKVLESDLRLCTAKVSASTFSSGDPMMVSSSMNNVTERRFVFQLISMTGKIHYLQAESAEAMEKWVTVLRSGLLNCSTADGESRLPRMLDMVTAPSTIVSRNSLRSLGGVSLLDEPQTAGNRSCADCLTNTDVIWASTNLGVTLCTDCAACHRSVGVHVSKVRSLVLDNWEPELLELMHNLGNNLVSSVYESDLHSSSSSPTIHRPQPGEVNSHLRKTWIEAKWVRRVFVRSFVHPTANNWLLELYRAWLTQTHSRRVSRTPDSPSSHKPVVSKTIRAHHPRPIDRRRVAAVSRGSTARAQVILDALHAHLDSLMLNETQSLKVGEVADCREEVAARLVLVAGARLGCAPFILAGLARGASPNALLRAADWTHTYRLPFPTDGDPLGAQTPPLIFAVNGGRIAACELLLTNGADINAPDRNGRTALHHACSLQRVHVVCLLLRRQANQDIKDKFGRLPIDVALDTANADIVTLLRLQHLNSNSKIADGTSLEGGQDETAIEVFRDFTSRAYYLEWDSEKEDYNEPTAGL
uniref:Arf-GAP with coiled-coil, ANK repeat and PH domain-containing protein 2 n=1 Tax=Mesocestoides corti TaxID=53468 RepID=A0A5K3FHE7_MESCO